MSDPAHLLPHTQALERAPPPRVEEMHDSVAKGLEDFAKGAEKLSPFSVIGEQTKACPCPCGLNCTLLQAPGSLAKSWSRLNCRNRLKNALKKNWPKIFTGFIQVCCSPL